jgi:hypothetical protein
MESWRFLSVMLVVRVIRFSDALDDYPYSLPSFTCSPINPQLLKFLIEAFFINLSYLLVMLRLSDGY